MEEIVNKIDKSKEILRKNAKKLFETFIKYGELEYKYINKYRYRFKIGKTKIEIYSSSSVEIRTYTFYCFGCDGRNTIFEYSKCYDRLTIAYEEINLIQKCISKFIEIVQNKLMILLEETNKCNEIINNNSFAYKEEKQWLKDYEKALGVL